jgi:thiamine transport system permease protein
MDAVASTIDADVRAAAALAGASPSQVWWWIDRPILQRAMLSGAALAAAVSLGEFGAATFLARADSPTVPVAIVRLLGRPGTINARMALALAVVLMIMVSSAAVAADRFGRMDGRR